MCRLDYGIVAINLSGILALRAAMAVRGTPYNFEKDLAALLHPKRVGDLLDDEHIGVWLAVLHVFRSILGDEDITVDYSLRMIMLRPGHPSRWPTMIIPTLFVQTPIASPIPRRITLDRGDSHEGLGRDPAAEALEVEDDLIPRMTLDNTQRTYTLLDRPPVILNC